MMMHTPNDSLIFDFKTQPKTVNWVVVNDGVMGGLSKGNMSLTQAGNGLFSGVVTTENNGGFSSVKYGFPKREVSGFKSLKIRLKGDGKSYQFRIKSDQAEAYSYIHEFQTSGKLETISIPFAVFYPSFRGNKIDLPNFSGTSLEEVGFLIGTKKNETFALEIQCIWLA